MTLCLKILLDLGRVIGLTFGLICGVLKGVFLFFFARVLYEKH